VVVLLLTEPVAPAQRPVSFALIAVPLLTAFAHGPYVVAGATVFTHRRLRSWGVLSPDELLRRLHTDLLAHSHDRLRDDIAALTACLLADEGGAPRGGAAPEN
jgi:hypothetical protein